MFINNTDDQRIYDALAQLLQEVDDDLIREVRDAPWEQRKSLLSQLDNLKHLKERLNVRTN